jgi:roadblock/LC7 domain-containing protein
LLQIGKADDDASLLVQSSTMLDEKMAAKSAEMLAAKQHMVCKP